MKKITYILPAVLMALGATAFVSCDDMLDMGNDDVLYTNDNTLQSANDTVNTFVGILYQMQKIAVRTNLFGELRGDLTTVYSTANANLKAIADFTVDDTNPYNNPRDYYAVINNCNYFIANANTQLTEQRYANNTLQDYYVLRAEYVAVRAMRAWLYLQLGQIYGEGIPLVTDPVLSLEDVDDASNNARRCNLRELCDYFINDLTPYVDWFDYPHHGNPGRGGYSGSTPSRMSVFPIQLVLGDLYLWLASIDGNPDLARNAAENYYKYLVWVPNATGTTINNTGYKQVNRIGPYRDYWGMDEGKYMADNSRTIAEYTWYRTGSGSFGTAGNEVISVIAMDSVAAESHFNTLRYLYSYNQENVETPASLGPSKPCIDYSDSQVYGDYYKPATSITSNFIVREPESVPETMRQLHWVGDMRLGANLYDSFISDGKEMQVISKSYNTRDVIIYRTGDVYLRLAEAMNYAGFPKFARYVLTTGIDEIVVDSLVMSQCDNARDSAFLKKFSFPRTYFRTQLSASTTTNNPSNNYWNYWNSNPNEFNENVNQIGIHQRGSGNAHENPYYYPAEVDEIPLALADAPYPVQPPFYNSAGTSNVSTSVLLDNLKTNNPELIALATSEIGLEVPDLDVLPVDQWESTVYTFRDNLRAYSQKIQALWRKDVVDWRCRNAHLIKPRQEEVVDSLLDIESALETCFEGFRFGFLMRADYRCGGRALKMGGGRVYAPGQYLAERVGKRDATLQGRLMDRSNWFIKWNGQIGKK